MSHGFSKSQIALAVAAALGATARGDAPARPAQASTGGTYVAGDFHNHTTCSDGSISMQKLVKKSTDKADTPWGLDWFVQAGHGGNGNRNCTLVEDATPRDARLSARHREPTARRCWARPRPGRTPIRPMQPKGAVSGTAPNQNMWRWQSMQEFQYPLLEYLAALQEHAAVPRRRVGRRRPRAHLDVGHHGPDAARSIYARRCRATPGYTPLGNATALAQWEYCFDRGDTDTSRGNTTSASGVGNNWDCSVPGSLNAADPSWNATAQKLIPAGGTGIGTAATTKTVEAMKWMAQIHPNGSYYVPAHLERAGPFNPNGNNGFNIEHLRNFNNAAPTVAFGMETQPGHGASDDRGEYTHPPQQHRHGVGIVDSVGGTTYGGTGVYGAQIGGVWDALLGEGRNWWFFASSDWHNRGIFGPDDRRSTQDFYPGEYQRNYVMVRTIARSDRKLPLNPQEIVDGLRTGNSFAASGQLDRSPRVRGLRRHAARRPRRQRARGSRRARRGGAEHRRRPRPLRDDGREARRAARRGDRRGDRRARSVGHELLAVHVPESVAGADRHHSSRSTSRCSTTST